MMSPSAKHEELRGLIAAMREGMLSDKQAQRLNAILADDPSSCDVFARYIFLQAMLELELVKKWPNLLAPGRVQQPLGSEQELQELDDFAPPVLNCRPENNGRDAGSPIIAVPLEKEDVTLTSSLPSSHSPLNFLPAAYHGTVNLFSQEVPFACLMSTLIVGFLLVIASLITKEHYTQIPGQSVASAERSYAAPESERADKTRAVAKEQKEEVFHFVGRITGMVDCKWADPGRTFSSSTDYLVAIDDKYSLTSGLMEITYDTGAKVFLQGPVTYQVESANGGYMSVGKLTGKVEVEKAKGFCVRTPTAMITDLGTEFGVEVNKKGVTRSHVFQGRVVVRAVNAAGKEYGREVTLDENQSVQVAAEGSDNAQDMIVVTTSDTAEKATAAGFARKLPVVDPRAYAKAVLADEPVFYWTFDEPFGSALEQVRQLPQQALNMNGFANRCSHRNIGSGLMLGRAADFNYGEGSFESEALDYGTMPRSWAIEFWVQFTDQGSKAAEQGSLSKPRPYGFGGYTHQYVLEAAGPSSPSNHPSVLFDFDCGDPNRPHRELILNSPSGSLKSGPQINDQNWHHVIFAFYGNDDPLGAASRVFIVVDGFFQTVDDCNGFHSSFDLQNKLFVGSDNLKNGPMCGRLDELAIYDLSNLSVERIEARVKELAQRHLAAARPLTQM